MAEKKRNLGRGLSAIFGEEPVADGSGAAPRTVPTAQLHPGRYQPRHAMSEMEIEELASSIREVGVLQPLLVRDHPEKPGEFEIVAGERRWRAAQRAQLHEVPVVIRTLSHREAAEVALIENLQRQDLSPLEEAIGYQRLMDEFQHNQEALAKAVGKSRPHVANMLRLLKLPDEIRAMLDSGRLTAGHARALIGVENASELAARVIAQELSVRETEKLVSGQSGDGSPDARKKTPARAKDTDTMALERSLGDTLGLKVDIASKGAAGRLTIHYRNLDQLDDLLNRLSHGNA